MGGRVLVTLVSADIDALLRQIEQENMVLFNVHFIDELTIRFRIKSVDYPNLEKLLQKRGASVKSAQREGIGRSFRLLMGRPVLLVGITFLILLGLYLPTRIFFLRVQGNQLIPTKLILEMAEECGIAFGASARDVRSEKVKNALLEAVPELQWAGINTSGCVATISVKERQVGQAVPQDGTVTKIVAVRDGVICDMTVSNGAPVCKVGQAVSQGDTLISGYIDCDRSVRATRSRGEVYASTTHQIEALMPLDYMIRGTQMKEKQKISIIFGKKRINFFSGSGILDSSCVKMYEEKYVTLPGSFQLPIIIVTETWITCQLSGDDPTVEDATERLSSLSENYIQQQMLAGSIISQREEIDLRDGVLRLTGEYGCIEMIGREVKEEIIKP